MRIFVILLVVNLAIVEITAKKDCKTRIQQCENRKQTQRKQVCGSDNQTYPNRCALIRVKCAQNSVLTVKHEGKCKEKQPCFIDQGKKLTKSGAHNAKAISDYMPECLTDGTYAPVQCHFGYCWCVTPNGKMIQGTSTSASRHQKINCPRRGRLNGSNDGANSSKTGCDNKCIFTKNLVNLFKTEYVHDGREVRRIHKDTSNTKHTADENLKAIEWKFYTLDADESNSLTKNEYKDLRAMIRKVVKPKRFARKFVRLCDINRDAVITKQEWINCLNINWTIANGPTSLTSTTSTTSTTTRRTINLEDTDVETEDPNNAPNGLGGSLFVLYERSTNKEKELESKVNNCWIERKSAMEEQKPGNQVTFYIPECTPDGRWSNIQCFSGFCWCVEEDSGKTIIGTTVKNATPTCEKLKNQPPSIPGCPEHKRISFVQSLIDTFNHNFTDLNANNSEPSLKDSRYRFEELAIRGYHSFDLNKNKILDRKEWKPFRQMVAAMNKPLKKCGRRFLRTCDVNRDSQVVLTEWLECIRIPNMNILDHSRPPSSKRRGPNPIESILKEDR